MSTTRHSETNSDPTISHTPDLPAINWESIGASAPTLLDSEPNFLKKADAVVITYAESEWAAMVQVFCESGTPMPYSAGSTSYWEGWHEFKQDMPSIHGWTYWFYYRLVEINGKKVYIMKSNTHLDYPGEAELEKMTQLIIDYVQPELLLSIGTAGGARVNDHIGTVNITNAGTLYSATQPQKDWPIYSNKWQGSMATINSGGFKNLLFPVPTTQEDLDTLLAAFNKEFGTNYDLDKLSPGGIDFGQTPPAINNFTPGETPLLTTATFVVATSAGNYGNYVAMEMDDAVLGRVCNNNNTPFGFVRNISDPVQAADIPFEQQKDWGGMVFKAYGFYTSFNGALATWAMLNDQL